MDSIPTNSAVTKILSVATKLAPVAGLVHGLLGDPMGAGRGIMGAGSFIYDRVVTGKDGPGLLQGHIGNPLITTQLALSMPDRYPIMSGIAAGIGGLIAQKIGESIDAGLPGQIVSGLGKFFSRYGWTAAGTSILSAWIYLSPFNPGEAGGPGHTNATGYSQGRTRGGPGATNTYWQTRGGAQIRNPTSAVDIYPT